MMPLVQHIRNTTKQARVFTRLQVGNLTPMVVSRKDLLIQPETELVIEGFPRSANTFGVLLVEQHLEQNLHIAHHLHLAYQLEQGVQRGLPSVLLLRNPQDSIPSLLLRNAYLSPWLAFHWFRKFHEPLVAIKDQLLVWEFESLTQHPARCLQQLASDFPDLLLGEEESVQADQVFQQIDQLDRETKQQAGEELDLVRSRPNLRKAAAKAAIQTQLQNHPRYRALMEEALQMYQQLRPQP
ncbi:MAG: hypothetical protein AAF399_13465 [Bacteroidota bacterium]